MTNFPGYEKILIESNPKFYAQKEVLERAVADGALDFKWYARWLEKYEDRTMDPDVITNMVCAYFNVPKGMLFLKCRQVEVVKARAIIWTHLLRSGKFTLSQIGRYFNKHHATVIHLTRHTETKWKKDYQAIFG